MAPFHGGPSRACRARDAHAGSVANFSLTVKQRRANLQSPCSGPSRGGPVQKGKVRHMARKDAYRPGPEHKFSFGLWTIGNRGRDPFGDFVRAPIEPVDIVEMLAEVGAWGVNLHDNDLVPIDASPADRDCLVRKFKGACQRHGIVVPMATVSLFFHPVFRDGAFTANDAEVRAYALQKTMRAMDLGAELGAKIFVLWGGREGVETDACRRPDEAVKRLREAVNYLCEY